MMNRSVAVLLLTLLGVACADEVMPPEPDTVARVDVTAPAHWLTVGSTIRLSAIPRGGDGRPLEGRTIAWSSSDGSVATVSSDGVVTGRSEGDVQVRATIEGRDGQVVLTVHAQAVARVAIDPPGSMTVDSGSAMHLRAVPYAADDTELAGRTASWASSNESVARVDGAGVLLGRAPGQAVITATIEGVSAQASIRVRRTAQSVAFVEVLPRELLLAPGGSGSLTARVRAVDGTELPGRTVLWSSGDVSIATVNGNGAVQASGAGVVWIRATSEGVSDSAKVVVMGSIHAPLASLDEHPLPAVWRVIPWVDENGVEIRRIVKVIGGWLRVNPGSQAYEQQLTMELWEDVYVLVNGAPVYWGTQLKETKVFDDRGSATPIHSGVGMLTFRSETRVGHTFTGYPLGSGFEVTQRIIGSGDPVRLRFAN